MTSDQPTAPGRASRAPSPALPAGRRQTLRGPIPLDWLMIAARLPGKSLHVGIALWFISGMSKAPVVALTNIDSVRFALDRNAKYRALAWLEKAGLVSVQRKLGRAPLVTILEAGGSDDRQF